MNGLLILYKDINKFNTRNKMNMHAIHINHMTYVSRKLDYRGRSFWNKVPTALKQKLPQIPPEVNLNNNIFRHIDLVLILSAFDYTMRE